MWCVLDPPTTKKDCTSPYTGYTRRAVQSLGILFSTEVLSYIVAPFWAFMYGDPMSLSRTAPLVTQCVLGSPRLKKGMLFDR